MSGAEHDIRDRLQGLELPSAPERLRERLVAVVATPRPATTARPMLRQIRILVPLAAVLVVAASAVLWSAGGPPSRSEWGPLAVASAENGDEARTEGTIRLTDRCVFLERGRELTTLAWPASRTTWDPSDNAITFHRSSGELVVVHDGQDVALGGGGSSRAEDGTSAEQWTEGYDWTATPAPDCVTDQRWFLNDIETLSTVSPRIADLVVEAFVGEGCLQATSACLYGIELVGPTETWHTGLESTGTQADMQVGPGLPQTLEPGAFVARAWLYFSSDFIILPHPLPSFGPETCSAEIVVSPGDLRVTLDIHFNPDSCTIDLSVERPGETSFPTQSDPTSEPTPTWGVICEEFSTDLEPVLECATAIDATLAAIGPDHPPIAVMRFYHACNDVFGVIGDCAIEFSGVVAVTYVGASGEVLFSVRGWGGNTTAEQMGPQPTADPASTQIELATSGGPPVLIPGGQRVCHLALGGGSLTLHPDTGLGVQPIDGSGKAAPVVWPYGYTARIEDGRAVLLNEVGTVVATQGDIVQFGGGLGIDGVFVACGGVGVVDEGA